MKRFLALLVAASAVGLFAATASTANAAGCGYGGYGGYGAYGGGYYPQRVYRAPVYRQPYRSVHYGRYPAPVHRGYHHHYGPHFSFGFGF